jgi:DNA topoisomerase I
LKNAEEKIGKIEIKDEETDVVCEKCGRKMVVKIGRYGKFLACPGFPECRNTKPIFEEAGVNCPKCGGKVLIKKTRKGRKYLGCENYPECDFMSWGKPTKEKCPVCGNFIEKIYEGKSVKYKCSNKECGYEMKPVKKGS